MKQRKRKRERESNRRTSIITCYYHYSIPTFQWKRDNDSRSWHSWSNNNSRRVVWLMLLRRVCDVWMITFGQKKKKKIIKREKEKNGKTLPHTPNSQMSKQIGHGWIWSRGRTARQGGPGNYDYYNCELEKQSKIMINMLCLKSGFDRVIYLLLLEF